MMKGGGGGEPRSSGSCAACKFLKRRCSPTCLFAPYFRSDEPRKFAKVHKVFGASNVSKILAEVAEEHRHEAVNSLVYEAEARLMDPVYGCIGAIATLQRKMAELQHDLDVARTTLARCAAGFSPLSLLQDDQFLVNSLTELIPGYSGWGEGFNQSTGLSSSMDELSQLLFPK